MLSFITNHPSEELTTASLRGDQELQPQSKARSSRNSLLSLKYVT